MADSSIIEVIVETESYNFWWSVYNLKPSSWEDIVIYVNNTGKKEKHYATTILTKQFFKYVKEHDSEEDQKEECNPFNKNIDELIKEEKMLFGYYYDNPENSDFYEMVEIIDKRNAHGIRPSYIQIFHPAEQLTLDAVIEAVSQYCVDLLKIKPERISFKDVMPESEARRRYDAYLEEIKELEEFKKKGGKIKINMTPKFLEQFYGTKALFSIGGIENIQRGYLAGDKKIRIVLKDGSEQSLDDKKLN